MTTVNLTTLGQFTMRRWWHSTLTMVLFLITMFSITHTTAGVLYSLSILIHTSTEKQQYQNSEWSCGIEQSPAPAQTSPQLAILQVNFSLNSNLQRSCKTRYSSLHCLLAA